MLRRAMFRARSAVESLFGPLPGAMWRELKKPWVSELGIRGVIDGGASVGQFSAIARAAFPGARILAFEPLPDCLAKLERRFRRDANFTAQPIALGTVEEERVLRRSIYAPSSSLRAMGDLHRRAFPSTAASTDIRVRVRPLDAVLPEIGLGGPLLLKLDVQGFELEALRGAQHTLGHCSLVLLETSLHRLYEGEALFGEIHAFLAERGFSMAGLAGSLHDPRDGRLLQVDALFERTQ